jgi:DNA-binding beta-propeller fold protein YncE
MLRLFDHARWAVRGVTLGAMAALTAGGCSGSGGGSVGGPSPAGELDQAYYVYVGAESADQLHRVRLGPEGASVDRTVPVGEMAVETEGPHGLGTSPDGRYIYMTTGHGIPSGKLWKYEAGADTLVAAPILLGWFPATIDLTPDGLYAFVANFNLHGERIPSTVSVVYTPEMIEVAQITTCVMPHGLRMAPDGTHLYTNCMMDDLMVEIDTRTFEITRRFRVAVGEEGPVSGSGGMAPMGAMGPATCSPTWAEPSVDGSRIYVACNRGNRILEIDREAWTVLRQFDTGPGPYNLDVTPDGRMLVATLKPAAAVEFFDLESGTSLGTLPTTTTVTHGVVISPDSRFAFVTVEGVGAEPGKVDIFDLRQRERIASVEVGQQAGGITFWKMEPADAMGGGG